MPRMSAKTITPERFSEWVARTLAATKNRGTIENLDKLIKIAEQTKNEVGYFPKKQKEWLLSEALRFRAPKALIDKIQRL